VAGRIRYINKNQFTSTGLESATFRHSATTLPREYVRTQNNSQLTQFSGNGVSRYVNTEVGIHIEGSVLLPHQ
jgi:hypothetical protein